jgi:drug/metabolite transporter (DMT)-like permease
VLGAILAVLSAATLSLNNVAARRGVVSGTPGQAMVVTIPIGFVFFLVVAIAAGEIARLSLFTPVAMLWMGAVGIVHFVVGRYCNYRASQDVGVNLSAPVIQLQVVVTLILAVVVLHEPCSILQMLGGVLILAGSLIAQVLPSRSRAAVAADIGLAAADGVPADPAPAAFAPRQVTGYMYASLAALAYGVTPVMARGALENAGATGGILGGLLAYSGAAAVTALALLWSPLRRNVMALKRENVRWFIYSGLLVALAQGLFYSAISVAPVMLVMPIMQLSLVFRFIFSAWLNPEHEIVGGVVITGAAISLFGALMVSVNTDFILGTLAVPDNIARVLRWRV